MYPIDERDRLVSIPFPAMQAGSPEPSVRSLERGGCELTYWLIEGDKKIVIHFRCSGFYFGAPNEEVFRGHPLAAIGLKAYGFYEVVNSSWVRALMRINSIHSRFNAARWKDVKHYVITFHDNMFEAIGGDYSVRFVDDNDRPVDPAFTGTFIGETPLAPKRPLDSR